MTAPRVTREEREGMVYFHFFPARDQIAFMRYILEAYDNLGTQSTLPGSTRTTWAVPHQLAHEAHALLISLLSEVL